MATPAVAGATSLSAGGNTSQLGKRSMRTQPVIPALTLPSVPQSSLRLATPDDEDSSAAADKENKIRIVEKLGYMKSALHTESAEHGSDSEEDDGA